MPLYFYIHVRRSTPSQVTSIHIKDLNWTLKKENHLARLDAKGINRYVAKKIKFRLMKLELLGKHVDDPQGYGQYAGVRLGKHDDIRTVVVNYKLKRGFFARFFPQLSKVSYVIAEACSAIINLAALQMSSSSGGDKEQSKGFGIFGASTFFISGTIMYFYSQSSYTLSRLGMRLDKLLKGQPANNIAVVPSVNQLNATCSTDTKMIFLKLGMGSLVFTQIIVSNISGYEGLDALENRAATMNTVVPQIMLTLAKWVLVTFGSISAVSFVGSFFDQFTQDIERRLKSKRPFLLAAPEPSDSDSSDSEAGEDIEMQLPVEGEPPFEIEMVSLGPLRFAVPPVANQAAIEDEWGEYQRAAEPATPAERRILLSLRG